MFNRIDELLRQEAERYSCDDSLCKFAGTEYCINESCGTCKLHGCRGCKHFEECIKEGLLN